MTSDAQHVNESIRFLQEQGRSDLASYVMGIETRLRDQLRESRIIVGRQAEELARAEAALQAADCDAYRDYKEGR